MDERHVDVAIIGAGSAGLAAHAAARRHTDSLVLIERGPHGTTCARTGCMPSKLLIAAGERRARIAEAGEFGLTVDTIDVDGRAVMARVHAMRDEFVASVLRVVERIPAEQRIDGSACIEDANTLRVGDRRVHARSIVIATGSRPRVPEPFAALGTRVLTSDDVFELDDLPGSLAVIGGGVIGLELGQAFAHLGVHVRLFDRSEQIGPTADPRLAELATQLFSEALDCELGTTPQPRLLDDGVELCWDDRSGRACRERFDYVLVATGRQPNLDHLGLAATGLDCDERGIPRFDPLTMRCGDSSIFLAGDVDAREPVLHEAAGDGRVAGHNAARFPDVRAHRRQTRLRIAFTDPQFAEVGLRPDEIDAAKIAVGEVSFAEQGRSRVIGQGVGLARLYGCRATGKLLGAQLLGPGVEHLAHLLAWVVQHELGVNEILALPFYHPVVEEGLRTALTDLRHALDRGEGLRTDCLDCGPGG